MDERTPKFKPIAPNQWEEALSTEEDAGDLNLIEYPEKMLLHTGQLSRQLPKQLDLFDFGFPVSRKTPDERITGSITMQEVYDQLPSLTHKDMLFYIGISRLWNEGYTTFTPQIVYKYASSNKNIDVTEKKKQEVIESINKMRSMLLTVDVSSEYVGIYRKEEAGTKVELNENLLYIEMAQVTVQGRTQEGYRLLKQPVLDRYAHELNQIALFDRDLLESGGSTEDALLHKYMAERLAGMENSNNSLGNKILLTSIYEALDLEKPDKHKRKKIKDKVDALLASWKSKGRIYGYEFVKKGRSWHAVDIHYKAKRDTGKK